MRGFIVAVQRLPDGSGSGFDVGSLGAFRPLGHFELDPLTFLQAAEALAGDRRKMDEHIRPAVLGCDEAETLGVVEPFDRTKTHCANLWIHGLGAPGSARNPLVLRPGRRKVPICEGPAQYEKIPGSHKAVGDPQLSSIAARMRGTSAVAAARCAKISSMLISASSPQPAAKFATRARQAYSSSSSRASAASGMPVMPTRSQPSRFIRAISARVSSRGPCVAP